MERIRARVLVLLHWLLDKSPRRLSQLGWLQVPAPPHQADLWRGLAKEFGELAFYGMVIFLIISLARKLPYQRFRPIHKLGAVLALLALLHSSICWPLSYAGPPLVC